MRNRICGGVTPAQLLINKTLTAIDSNTLRSRSVFNPVGFFAQVVYCCKPIQYQLARKACQEAEKELENTLKELKNTLKSLKRSSEEEKKEDVENAIKKAAMEIAKDAETYVFLDTTEAVLEYDSTTRTEQPSNLTTGFCGWKTASKIPSEYFPEHGKVACDSADRAVLEKYIASLPENATAADTPPQHN